MGPLCPEQLTQEETLDEVCVGPEADLVACRQTRSQFTRCTAGGVHVPSSTPAFGQ
jgi:hypothetical protein